ncbi:MAG: protein kinase [Acidobacteriota bacterium]|nr:protein kinase [Acidobacteriota bacterium]
MFQAGQKFGNYVLIKKLAKGGFGEVWLAEKRSQFVTKKVAAKLPHAGQFNFEAIRQEATLWEKASGHPNVLPLIDADIYDGQVVILSEYIEDGSLADKLRKYGRLPVREAVRIVVGVLNGLEYLHSKSIIHRDIKPANILMQGDTPRLADFGISRAVETTMVSSTVIGTHSYMSPESFEGVRSVQTDVWSVGVLLYHLVTGRLPFPLGQPSEIMYAVLMRAPDPLPDEIPQRLQQIIYRALEKDRNLADGNPPRRYQSAAAMREDLESFLEWFATEPQPSPFETVKVFPTAQSAEINTRMRIPLKTGGVNPLKDFSRALVSRKLSTTALFSLLLAVGAAVVLLAVFLGSRSSSTAVVVPDSANINPSGVNSANPSISNSAPNPADADNTAIQPADDAAIRASKEFHRQGNNYYSRRQFDKAIETYTLAIELNRNDFALYNNRGAAYHASGEYQKAIADYTKSIELNPYYFSAYNNRAEAYKDIGSIEQAVADYRKALEIDPENKLVKDNLKRIQK